MRGTVLASAIVVLSATAIVVAEPTYQGDPQAVAELRAVPQKFLAISTWHARYTFASGMAQTAEYVAPDRFHMISQRGGVASDTYYIGGEVWVRIGSDCKKMPVPVPGMNPREYAAQSTGTITVAKGGPDVVEGTRVQTYMVSSEQQGQQVQTRLLVAVATNLPRRIEARSDKEPFTVDYFDYGAPIVINNPPC